MLSLLVDRLVVAADVVAAELEVLDELSVVVAVGLDAELDADANSCRDVKKDNASEANIVEPLVLGASDRADADWEEVAEFELDCRSCPVEDVELVAVVALDCIALISD